VNTYTQLTKKIGGIKKMKMLAGTILALMILMFAAPASVNGTPFNWGDERIRPRDQTDPGGHEPNNKFWLEDGGWRARPRMTDDGGIFRAEFLPDFHQNWRERLFSQRKGDLIIRVGSPHRERNRFQPGHPGNNPPAPVPEPATFILMATGMGVFLFLIKFRKNYS
jgi:hypothetical protein